MDPRCDKTATSTVLTTGSHVHDIDINEVGNESIQGPNGSDMDSGISPLAPYRSQPSKKEKLLKPMLSYGNNLLYMSIKYSKIICIVKLFKILFRGFDVFMFVAHLKGRISH